MKHSVLKKQIVYNLLTKKNILKLKEFVNWFTLLMQNVSFFFGGCNVGIH